jgi:CDP-diacylglycerol---glycerol-3-phosphate 3-phosphatidyltransferase
MAALSPAKGVLQSIGGLTAAAECMNLPNFLTILRIFLVPLLVVVLLTRFENWQFIGVAIFLAAALTDWLDGHIARSRRQMTALGAWLDPIADKLLVGAAFIALVELQLAPAWIVVIIVGREVLVTALRNIALFKGFTVNVSYVGKAKMAVEVVAITALILGERSQLLAQFGHVTLWAAMALALVSAFQYFRSFWMQVGVPLPGAPVRHPLVGLTERQKGNASTEQFPSN